MRISRSSTCIGKLITLFRGDALSSAGLYTFLDSELIFSRENLAGNLVELCGEADKIDIFKSKDLSDLILQLTSEFADRRLSVVEVAIVNDLDRDISLTYLKPTPRYVVENAKSDLTRLGFSIETELKDSVEYLYIKGCDIRGSVYLQVKLSRQFIERRSSRLSDNMQSMFDPNRYVDTQIIWFFIMSSLMAEAMYDERSI